MRKDTSFSDRKLTTEEFSKKYWLDGKAPYQYHTGSIEDGRDEREQFLFNNVRAIMGNLEYYRKLHNEQHKENYKEWRKEQERTKEAQTSMKTVCTEFNKIVLTEIFPLIPKAFQTLAAELSGARLRPQSGIEAEIMLKQASLLKEKISQYIDRQVDASIQIFKD